MKKQLFFLTALLLAVVSSGMAQVAKGAYVMKQLCGEDGKYQPAPAKLEQYKISNGKEILFLTIVSGIKTTGGVSFSLRHEATPPLSSTLSGEEIMRTQIFDVTPKSFKLKWFNMLPSYRLFPQNTWVTEDWQRTKLTQVSNSIMQTLHSANAKGKNRLQGVWLLKGRGTSDSEITPQDMGVYKVYGKKHSVVLFGLEKLRDNYGTANGYFRDVEYVDENLTREDGASCLLQWVDDNNIRLAYFSSSGQVYLELWERSQVDSDLQALFDGAF
jgi:hypothetical protein